MGLIKGILKVGASAVLVAAGTSSAILKGVTDIAGLEIGSELLGAAKDASFNGIKKMWNIDTPPEEEYATEEEAEAAATEKEIRQLKIEIIRKYVNIDDIQKEYLPISKKKIRCFVKKYLPVKCIGSRMYVERASLEELLTDPDRDIFSLK